MVSLLRHSPSTLERLFLTNTLSIQNGLIPKIAKIINQMGVDILLYPKEGNIFWEIRYKCKNFSMNASPETAVNFDFDNIVNYIDSEFSKNNLVSIGFVEPNIFSYNLVMQKITDSSDLDQIGALSFTYDSSTSNDIFSIWNKCFNPNRFKNLETLCINDITWGWGQINPGYFRFFDNIKKLKTLYICGGAACDSVIFHLKELKNLELLKLEGGYATDASIDSLNQLTNLRILDLSAHGMSDQGMLKLNQSLPHTVIILRK